MSRTLLDATGLTCPLPVLRARKVLQSLAAGEELEVLATDAAADRDFPAFCEATGHALLEHSVDGETRRFVIRKGPAAAG